MSRGKIKLTQATRNEDKVTLQFSRPLNYLEFTAIIKLFEDQLAAGQS